MKLDVDGKEVELSKSLHLWERGLKWYIKTYYSLKARVAPLVGAWIEISKRYGASSNTLSLHLWERGLKWLLYAYQPINIIVAPLVGAWIEISFDTCTCSESMVAPLVGAWIEIKISNTENGYAYNVAPLVGAWIEIMDFVHEKGVVKCRSTCGSVD